MKSFSESSPPVDANLGGFIMTLRRFGVSDHRVLSAFETVDRKEFLPPSLHRYAYAAHAIPLDCGQVALSPLIMARAVAALNVQEDERVLEIGTGSGYITTILSQLARVVWSLERWRKLEEIVRSRLQARQLQNVTLRHADGLMGAPVSGPFAGEGKFERILISAAVDEIPEDIKNQLTPNGVVVAFIGASSPVQQLVRGRNLEKGLQLEPICPARVPPAIPRRSIAL